MSEEFVICMEKIVFAAVTVDSSKHVKYEIDNQSLTVKVLFSIGCGKFDLI